MLGERSSLDDQSVPRTGKHSEPYKIDDRCIKKTILL